MSTFLVGIKNRDYDNDVVRVEGVSHYITVHNTHTGMPVEVVFYSKKKGKIPEDLRGVDNQYKALLAVPYSELAYYQRVSKK